jgi:hypothetical protein
MIRNRFAQLPSNTVSPIEAKQPIPKASGFPPKHGTAKKPAATESINSAIEDHGASQKECATAVGKSETLVRDGYPDDSPFGPTTKAGRVAHAQEKSSAGAAKGNKAKANLRKPASQRLDGTICRLRHHDNCR